MTEQNPPVWLQGESHTAEIARRALSSLYANRSFVFAGLEVTEKSGTPDMSVDIAEGECFVEGTEGTYQGGYVCEARSSENVAVTAADPTNPRIDRVVAKVEDSNYSGATDAWSLAVVAGTPAASPVAPTAPANSITIATISVAALATSVVDANITISSWFLELGPEDVAVGGELTIGRLVSTLAPTEVIDAWGGGSPKFMLRTTDATDPGLALGDALNGSRLWMYYDISAAEGVIAMITGTAMRIGSDGRLGFGTSPITNRKISGVVTGTSMAVEELRHDAAVGSGSLIVEVLRMGDDGTNPGTNDTFISFRKGDDTVIGSIKGTGSASVNYATTSDQALKRDLGLVDPAEVGDIIDSLRVHRFDWLEGEVTNQIGLFAQEAIDVLPDTIVDPPDYDPEGRYVPAQLDYSKIVPILLAELQSLRERVATLGG